MDTEVINEWRNRLYESDVKVQNLTRELALAKQTIDILNKTIYDLNIELSYREDKNQNLYEELNKRKQLECKITDKDMTIIQQEDVISHLKNRVIELLHKYEADHTVTGHISYQQLIDSFLVARKERDRYKQAAESLEENRNYWKSKHERLLRSIEDALVTDKGADESC